MYLFWEYKGRMNGKKWWSSCSNNKLHHLFIDWTLWTNTQKELDALLLWHAKQALSSYIAFTVFCWIFHYSSYNTSHFLFDPQKWGTDDFAKLSILFYANCAINHITLTVDRLKEVKIKNNKFIMWFIFLTTAIVEAFYHFSSLWHDEKNSKKELLFWYFFKIWKNRIRASA